jgi:hypothetical protein
LLTPRGYQISLTSPGAYGSFAALVAAVFIRQYPDR